MNNKIKSKYFLLIPIVIFTGIFFSSCYPDYGLSESDYDIVLTLYDSTIDFTKYKTYILPDSVVQLGGSSTNNSYSQIMLNSFSSQLESRGYRRIYPSDSVRADLVALVSVTTTENYVYYYDYWSYWGWYGWGGYYPWGPGYSYYPYYSGYTFTTGTMFMNLIDVARSDTVNKKIASVWLGAVNGVIESSNPDRIINGVNQAFYQSPYIRTY